jgi:hypothetical protein
MRREHFGRPAFEDPEQVCRACADDCSVHFHWRDTHDFGHKGPCKPSARGGMFHHSRAGRLMRHSISVQRLNQAAHRVLTQRRYQHRFLNRAERERSAALRRLARMKRLLQHRTMLACNIRCFFRRLHAREPVPACASACRRSRSDPFSTSIASCLSLVKDTVVSLPVSRLADRIRSAGSRSAMRRDEADLRKSRNPAMPAAAIRSPTSRATC